jgi:hypothetical protein
VIAADADRDAVVLAEVQTQSFAEQLLPAVSIIGVSAIRIGLFQRDDVGVVPKVARVDACGRRVEVRIELLVTRRLE